MELNNCITKYFVTFSLQGKNERKSNRETNIQFLDTYITTFSCGLLIFSKLYIYYLQSRGGERGSPYQAHDADSGRPDAVVMAEHAAVAAHDHCLQIALAIVVITCWGGAVTAAAIPLGAFDDTRGGAVDDGTGLEEGARGGVAGGGARHGRQAIGGGEEDTAGCHGQLGGGRDHRDGLAGEDAPCAAGAAFREGGGGLAGVLEFQFDCCWMEAGVGNGVRLWAVEYGGWDRRGDGRGGGRPGDGLTRHRRNGFISQVYRGVLERCLALAEVRVPSKVVGFRGRAAALLVAQ